MAIIETKFSVGDVVWSAGVTTETKQHPCPDCLGSRKWEAKSPAGGVFAVECPRCSNVYQSNRALNLTYSLWTASADRRTIGLVRACSGSDGEHEYMCHETGIGSGTLYRESLLFATEAEARACGQAMAAVNNANASGWVAKQYSDTAQFCDYQLKDAAMEGAISAARNSMFRVGYLVGDLETATSLDEVAETIRTWRERADSVEA